MRCFGENPKYFKGLGDTKLSKIGCNLVISANLFSEIWDTFQDI